MKPSSAVCALMLLAGLLAVPGRVGAGQDPAGNGRRQAPVDVRKLLEKGQASGSLPEDMIVRIGACLGEAEEKARGHGAPQELHETWEFTSNRVYRVDLATGTTDNPYPRVESRPFDSKDLCKDLLDGKAIQIQARKGEGPDVVLAGTIYRRGSRSIEIVWRGETILDLHETNGPFLDVYRESDARAFGALYERLASQARILFGPPSTSPAPH